MKPKVTVLELLAGLALTTLAASCGPPKAVEAAEVIRELPKYLGKPVVMRAKFRSGARCRQEAQPGEGEKSEKPGEHKWATYCGDCQVCRGPVVIDTGAELPEGADDWPLILGGTYGGRDIRCKGKLNEIECYPFVQGKTYVVQGEIENQKPPKLLVRKFWEVDNG